MKEINETDLGKSYPAQEAVDDIELITVNEAIQDHPIEKVGKTLRAKMKGMKALVL
jgi:ketol-acid reductoisomerase